MENGGGDLENKFAGLVLKDSNHNGAGNDGLFQVMKAVEAAEATIKQQVEENNRLRGELQKKIQEVEKYLLPRFNKCMSFSLSALTPEEGAGKQASLLYFRD